MLILNVFFKKLIVILNIILLAHTQKKYQDHVPCSFAYKIVCVDNRFGKKINLYRGTPLISLLNYFLVSTIIAKKW